jgi:hypothetical protein
MHPGSAQKKEEQKMENLSSGELTWNTLLPYKNHINGEKRFNESVRKHPDDPTPQWFVTTLKMVLNDETLRPRQEDPLGIVEACQMMKDIQPNFFFRQETSYGRATSRERLSWPKVPQLPAIAKMRRLRENSSKNLLSHGLQEWVSS